MAENKKHGDMGTKQRDGEAIIATAKIEAQNQKAQNEQRAQIAMSNKELDLIRHAGLLPSSPSHLSSSACLRPRFRS